MDHPVCVSPFSRLLQQGVDSLCIALFLPQQRKGQKGPCIIHVLFGQLAIQLYGDLIGSALSQQISQKQADL